MATPLGPLPWPWVPGITWILTIVSSLEEPSAAAACFHLVKVCWGTVKRHMKLWEADCHCASVPSTGIFKDGASLAKQLP